MKLKPVVAAVVLLSGISAASAITSQDNGPYTITFDETTSFGSLSGWFGSGDSYGFNWTVPNSVKVSSPGGSDIITTFVDLPSFTISANPGWSLSGGFTAFLGNLSYTEVGGATTGILAYGDVTVDGSPAGSADGLLIGWTATDSGPTYSVGYFGDTYTAPIGAFSTLAVSNARIVLSATGGAFSSISAQPQNKLEFSFTAVPVPEPETYAMMLCGLAAVGWVARRRRS
jgi:hypothetical protein